VADPFVSNFYSPPQVPADEVHSFESISYTSPAPAVVTIFRAPMQAPEWEWYRPSYDWWQGPSLSLLSAHVYLREPMQAPEFFGYWYDWRQADNPVNLTPLHASLTPPLHFRVIGSSFVGDPYRVVGSKIVRRYQ
jgi:hypothetical protein